MPNFHTNILEVCAATLFFCVFFFFLLLFLFVLCLITTRNNTQRDYRHHHNPDTSSYSETVNRRMSSPEDKFLQDGGKSSNEGDVKKEEHTNISSDDKITLKRKHISRSLVSVIMPVHNAEEYLEEAFASIIKQTYRPLELVCFNDCSTDSSWTIIQSWQDRFKEADIITIMLTSDRDTASGPGYGRNQAIQKSHGEFICHLDADDYMHTDRIESQFALSQQQSDLHTNPTLIGSNFVRFPADSTPFYTEWLNQLTPREMLLQQYRECTIICPSWFYSRDVYSRVRIMNGIGFIEKDPLLGRVPEDLIFFLDHLLLGGGLAKVERPLVTYRYVNSSWSIGTKALDLQRVRIKYLQETVLSTWSSFSIYGGGFDAKKFINLLSPENAKKVMMFGDIAPKRIGTNYFHQGIRKHIPIVHWGDLKKPLIICVASKRAGEELERNIQSLELEEGVDFFRFN